MDVLTAVGEPDPDPDLEALISTARGELGQLDPLEQPEEFNRLFGDLVALEQQRRCG